jgi:hypothetical protein
MQLACELRLLAAALELQHLTGAGANLASIPMTRDEKAPRFIAVGTAPEIRRLLEIAPVEEAAQAQANATGSDRAAETKGDAA